jgi:hypothetical protein
MVETQSDEILANAQNEDVALLVVGDPFGSVYPLLWLQFIYSPFQRYNPY